MESTIQILIKKYPQLAYFDITTVLSPQQLQLITPEIHKHYRGMSPSCKHVFKIVRDYAEKAKNKFKNGKNLYKTIKSQQEFIDSIILNNSKLRSIQALEYRNLDNLSELQLINNEIRSISPLKNIRTPKLQEIDLSSNQIQSIKPLLTIQWPKLKILNLSQNSIIGIERLPIHSFTSIKSINLSDNFITNIKWLRKVFTPELISFKHLNLSNNQIFDLHWLSECHFHKLEYLNLRNNKYSSIMDLEKIKMTQKQNTTNRITINHYQILLSMIGRYSSFNVGYRLRSRHKLSAKVEVYQERTNREDIQKSRRIKLH